jgi:hypothetical protein
MVTDIVIAKKFFFFISLPLVGERVRVRGE